MSGSHDLGNDRGTNGFTRAFAVGIALNTAFVAVEAFYGWRVNSLALLGDAEVKMPVVFVVGGTGDWRERYGVRTPVTDSASLDPHEGDIQ